MSTSRQTRPAVPVPGFYLVRLALGAWMIPAEITHEDGLYGLIQDGAPLGEAVSAADIEAALMDYALGKPAAPLLRVMFWGKPIAASVYRYHLALKQWAAVNEPNHPCLHPTKSIDALSPAALPF
jgi:hypothetical protein